ncbi:MAG: DUF4105 domain-containing protein [Sulfurimonas sp.]|uniref:Lnb N-terminal periplasmic domain-containing protein n=1 Tax=Sulfurimonas sp. TaxID=2022749 RepID=UPI00260FA078|nr:DUF4105 domain-containing protein [Sulfurimonas sp.]MDD5371795.1 DUF4105 domain-containing protein [Sulfurimonas sp.]
MNRRFFLLFIAPIILYASQQDVLKLANELQIFNKKEWKALLHYNQELNIYDENFTNIEKFSLKNELELTINGFYEPKEKYENINNHPQCKFPARRLFLINELNLSDDFFPFIQCLDFQNYLNKAPADTISLIYASENVKNPSSMMGHTFLKYSGINYQNNKVEHAVSFYTIIETLNLFELAYQNTYSGMRGFFALQPYQEAIKQYIDKENRNVWEYKLKLSDYRKRLMYYHIWELKDKDMQYFFTSYNCSTVIYYILSLANPKIYDDKKLWITPLDTVKFLYKYDLIEHSELVASNEWLVKMLNENVALKDVDFIKNIVQDSRYEDIDTLDYYSQKLLEAYATLKYKNGGLDKDSYKSLQEKISKNENGIDISKYKSPNNIPPERQFGIGYTRVDDKDFTKVSFLGASHLLNDNNREYFGESELKIGCLSLLANGKNIELEEFTLYGMKLYTPYDTLTHDLSYQFEIAVKKEFSKEMDYIDTLKIDGGVGIDFSIAHDINIFVLLNSGVGYNKEHNAHVFFNPQIGGMIYEIFNMKSLFYYQPFFIGIDKVYDKYLLNHNIFLSKNYKLYLNFEIFENKKEHVNYEFGLSKLF